MVNYRFKNRSNEKELIDNVNIDNAMLIKNLKEFEQINKIFGTQKTLIDSLNKIYKKYLMEFHGQKIIIADFGCGAGDLLHGIAIWAKNKDINSRLLGIDINEDIINYAIQKLPALSNVENLSFELLDIFKSDFKNQSFDVACINNVCHHFTNRDLISILVKLKNNVRLAVVINDLHRHFIAYYAIWLITRLFGFTHMARHDGPLSVLRAFTRNELIELLKSAHISDFKISWKWPFRWQVIIWCKRS